MARVVRRAKPKPVMTDFGSSIAIPNRVASIPNPAKYLDPYVNRTINGQLDFDILDTAMRRKMNVKIEGWTGTGKTSLVMAWAAYREHAFYSVSSSSGTEGSQLSGRIIPDEDNPGGFVWQDGPITDIMRYGGVILLNEVTFLPERFTTFFFGMLDKRREVALLDHKGEVIAAPENFLVIADHNPTTYRGSREMNEAFVNRFPIKLFFDYDPVVEAQLILSPSLRDLAAQIRVQVNEGIIDSPVSTNMLMEFETLAVDLGIDFAIDNFVNAFQTDSREAIRGAFNSAHRANIARDIKNIGKGSATQASADPWLPSDKEWMTYDASQFYTEEELTGKSRKALLALAEPCEAPDGFFDAMSTMEIAEFLCGKHPYWEGA
jgi:nitric oxide reductase NorQ protein